MKLIFCIYLFFFLNTSLFAQEKVDKINIKAKASNLINFRLGWQLPWTTQAQLVHIFKHTNILKNNGLNAEFVQADGAEELTNSALEDNVDVLFTEDQSAAKLFEMDKSWIGFSRLMYNRSSIYVPIHSKIKALKDLKGKVVGLPKGGEIERIASEAIIKAKLIPNTDVTITNLPMSKHFPLAGQSDKKSPKFQNFDALSGFDPIPAAIEAVGLSKTIYVAKVIGLALANKKFIEKNPTFIKKFKKSIAEAYVFYNKNETSANNWFLKAAHMRSFAPKAWKIMKSIEPNFKKNKASQMILDFSKEDFINMQKTADETCENIIISQYVSNNY